MPHANARTRNMWQNHYEYQSGCRSDSPSFVVTTSIRQGHHILLAQVQRGAGLAPRRCLLARRPRAFYEILSVRRETCLACRPKPRRVALRLARNRLRQLRVSGASLRPLALQNTSLVSRVPPCAVTLARAHCTPTRTWIGSTISHEPSGNWAPILIDREPNAVFCVPIRVLTTGPC